MQPGPTSSLHFWSLDEDVHTLLSKKSAANSVYQLSSNMGPATPRWLGPVKTTKLSASIRSFEALIPSLPTLLDTLDMTSGFTNLSLTRINLNFLKQLGSDHFSIVMWLLTVTIFSHPPKFSNRRYFGRPYSCRRNKSQEGRIGPMCTLLI